VAGPMTGSAKSGEDREAETPVPDVADAHPGYGTVAKLGRNKNAPRECVCLSAPRSEAQRGRMKKP
jgi:hypothetical protein